MTHPTAPVLRILNPKTRKWLGCGFLVPSPPDDQNIHIMTCAHVVADALEIEKDENDTSTPKHPVLVAFVATPQHARKAFPARVVEGHWFPSPPNHVPPAKRVHDIAVLRLDISTLPEEAKYVRFIEDMGERAEVRGYGPLLREETFEQARGYWVEARTRASADVGRIEAVVVKSVDSDKIFGGYSGSPLSAINSNNIGGMVRSAESENGVYFYGLPQWMLAEAWPHLADGFVPMTVAEGNGRRSSELPIFDLFNRDDQVTGFNDVIAPLRGDTAPIQSPVFMIAGDPDEDHQRLARRLELEAYLSFGESEFSYLTLKQARGINVEKGIELTISNLAEPFRIQDQRPKLIADAMSKHGTHWLIHYFTPARFGPDEADVLFGFLDIWREISEATECATALGISFFYDPNAAEPDTVVHKAYQDVLGHAVGPTPILGMEPLDKTDIDRWPDEILRHMPDADVLTARRVSRDIREIVGNERITMSELMYRIDKSSIEISVFEEI